MMLVDLNINIDLAIKLWRKDPKASKRHVYRIYIRNLNYDVIKVIMNIQPTNNLLTCKFYNTNKSLIFII